MKSSLNWAGHFLLGGSGCLTTVVLMNDLPVGLLVLAVCLFAAGSALRRAAEKVV